MKIQVLSSDGKKKVEIETTIFKGEIRKDLIQKVVESEKKQQPFSPSPFGGKQAAAAGKTKHARRKWRSAAGRGLSRVPRKVFWRRGTQFYWQGATVASARGGRRAHPPKVLSMLREKKVNKKEKEKAFFSALAMTASVGEIRKKYKSLEDKDIKTKFPIIVEDKILELKTKDFFSALKKVLQELIDIAIQKKSIRAGRGKSRGRKYRKTSGLLFVTGKEREKKIKGIEIKKSYQVSVSDLASNGARLVMYTEEAIKELTEKLTGKKAVEKAVKVRKKKTKRKEKKQKRKAKKSKKKAEKEKPKAKPKKTKRVKKK